MIGSRYSKENFPKILELVDGVAQIGRKYNATPGQVALAWLLEQGDDIIPIPGTKSVKASAVEHVTPRSITDCILQYLEENLGALNLKLSQEDVAEIRRLCENVQLGDRYPAAHMGMILQDTPPL